MSTESKDDEQVIRPANPKNMDPSAGVNWAQTEPHDILDQIDVMMQTYREGMAMLSSLRRQVAKEARYRWKDGVNGLGVPIKYKVPINQDGSDR